MSERTRLVLAVAFVVAMAALYLLSLSAPAPVVEVKEAERTPAPEAPTPAKKRPPRRAPAEPQRRDEAPSDEPVEEQKKAAALLLRGTVRDSAGAPVPGARIYVDRDGHQRPFGAKPDGSFEIHLPRGRVSIWAVRQDGLLQQKSPKAETGSDDGGEFDVDLVIPSEVRGGVGVGVGSSEAGMEVRFVHAGSPAAQAGIEAGDMIVALDGRSVAGWQVSDFVDGVTGPAGTTVRFTLRTKEGDDQELELVRQPLERTP